MTDDRKRNTGGEVELLPLPEWTYGGNHLRLKSAGLQQRVDAYARANVDRALAESRAEVAEWKASYQQAADSGAAHAARAERLAGALREAMEWNWLDDDARPSRIAELCDAALNLEPTP